MRCDCLFARVPVSPTAFPNYPDRQAERGHGSGRRFSDLSLRGQVTCPARPCPARPGCSVPARRAPGAPPGPGPGPAAALRVRQGCPCSPGSPEPPARLAPRELRRCRAAPSSLSPSLPAVPLEESGFFSVVGERKSASSKISEVQVHHIFLRSACYTLRESDCRAPGALLAVRGCSCFPLSQRQKHKWNLLTLSAVPSPVVVAVADLQALWINSKAGNKRSLLAAIISH